MMQRYLFLLILSLAPHTHLDSAQMNIEMKESAEEIKLTAEEQAAVNEMLAIIKATNKDNAAQQAQVLQKLLQRYPRIVDAKDYVGWAPLMYATRRGHAEIVKLLIAAGAQIDVQDNDGWTPLKNAAFNGYIEIVKLLIAAGAQIDAQNNYGATPIMLAARNGHAETVKLLIATGAQIDAQNNDGQTPLMHAARNGNAEIVKLLIAAGAQINAQSNSGLTALMYAASNDNPEIVKLLIAAGAQIDAQDNDGRTARDIAILCNRKEIYDNAVTAGLAEKERYEQAQQVAKQKITEVIFPDEIEEPEITEIIGEYAYNPKITGDLPQETSLEKAQRITKEIQEKALSCKREDLPKSPETKQSWWDKAKSLASKLYRGKS